jgi:Kef-type K+ transport system membrane component KefB
MLIQLILDLVNSQVYIGLALLLLGGYIVAKYAVNLKVPKVTGYIITGIILGPSILNVFNEKTLSFLEFVPYVTLGIIAVVIGASLNFGLLKNLKLQLFSITIFQALGAFFLTLIALLLAGLAPGAAVPLAAIACATAPAAIISVIREYKAYGTLTNMTLGVIALDDAISLIIFGIVLSFDIHNLSFLFLSEIFNSFLVGAALAFIAHFLASRHRFFDNAILIFSMIFLGIGLSKVLGLSYLLTNMFFGFVLVNINAKNKKNVQEIEKYTPPFYCLFFVLAGTYLDFGVFKVFGPIMIIWVGLFIVSRFLGKVGGVYLGARVGNSAPKIRKYLGLTLLPQVGVAIGLTMLIGPESYYFEYKSIILNITLAAGAVNELLGPFLAKYALVKSGEALAENP